MLSHGVGYVCHWIGGGPGEAAAPIPSDRIGSDSGINLGQARDCAGHHDSALADSGALATEIRYCVSSSHRRKSIGAGISRARDFRKKRQSEDLGSRSFEARIQILRGC
jgi:hypothetical protein